MEILFEQPITIGALGIGLVAILFGGWSQTGDSRLLFGVAGAALFTIVLLFVERYVETDRERVDSILRQLAKHVEANELDQVLERIHPQQNGLKQRVEMEMTRWTFSKVQINRNLKITPQPDHQPPQVTATFNCQVEANASSVTGNGLVFIEVVFWKYRDKWLVYDAEYSDVREGFKR